MLRFDREWPDCLPHQPDECMTHALIVEDDMDSAATLKELIVSEGLTVSTASNLFDARKQLVLQPPDIVLLDLRLPDGSGMDLFKDPELLANSEVVLITGHASLETSILALRLGAVDYLVKPLNFKHLQGVLSRVTKPAVMKAEVADLTAKIATSGHFGQLWGRAPSMQRVYEQISRVAGTGVTVFITGESGTGKEVVAQTIHELSRRRKMPFLGVNCGAISPNLDRERNLRTRKGQLHRRRAPASGLLRACGWRHPVSGRNHRDATGPAGQAPACTGDWALHARGRHPEPGNGRPHRRRHQSLAHGGGDTGSPARRPDVPPQCLSDRAAAAA